MAERAAAASGSAAEPSWPREVVLLCGAPGAGKGVMASVVMREREIEKHIEVSALLQSPDMLVRKAAGELVDDRTVTLALLRELSQPGYAGGVIVDGFPRSAVQAEVCALLAERLAGTRFATLVLYVAEEESVRRQLSRGRELLRHNQMLADTGADAPRAVRPTDTDEAAARKRWRLFKEEIFNSVQTIKHRFAFHYLDASTTKDEVERKLRETLAYRPDRELSQQTFAAMRSIETAAEVAKTARHAVVARINHYAEANAPVFRAALAFIEEQLMSIIRRQGLVGMATIRSDDRQLENPLLLNMVLDILAEHGFNVTLDVVRRDVPTRLRPDPLAPGEFIVDCRVDKSYVFHVQFLHAR